jgi:CHRD domain
MKLIKLTALTSFLFALLISSTGCMKNADKRISREFVKSGILMTGAQETPPVASTATGTLDVFYTRETRILTYTVRWSGLTGNVAAMHIHGQAPTGYIAGIFQTFTIASIVKCANNATTTCGSYTGTLLVDGVAIKENDLLNGFYYVNIHTAAFPGGEIRGQIRFQ